MWKSIAIYPILFSRVLFFLWDLFQFHFVCGNLLSLIHMAESHKKWMYVTHDYNGTCDYINMDEVCTVAQCTCTLYRLQCIFFFRHIFFWGRRMMSQRFIFRSTNASWDRFFFYYFSSYISPLEWVIAIGGLHFVSIYVWEVNLLRIIFILILSYKKNIIYA